MLSGLVAVGDKVSKLNGEDVLGAVAHDVVISMVKAARRPLLIHFVGKSAAAAALPAGAPPAPPAPPAGGGGAAGAPPPPQQGAPASIAGAMDAGSGLFDAL